jgi:aminoglycoside/choline kinase family phosphotransferase
MKTSTLLPPPHDVIAHELGLQTLTIEFLAGDGSDRCYFRILSPEIENSVVLMQLSETDATKLRNNGYDWISIAETLERSGVLVPRLIKKLPEAAALIIEDYGNIMFETAVFESQKTNSLTTIDEMYAGAMDLIAKMLLIQPRIGDHWSSRAFDVEKLLWEMKFFKKYFINMVCNLDLSAADEAAFERETASLCDYLAQYSKWFTHRDYHSRNIMVKAGRLALIDFQDARLGPASYDLVSLCFDSYVPLSIEKRVELMDQGIDIIRKRSGNHLAEEITANWRAMLLQRQLKAIGSFGYLTKEKKRGDYLKYVGPALQTLDHPRVVDERWPFLSRKLIEMMKRCPK